MGQNWPGTEMLTDGYSRSVETGDVQATVFGLVVAAAGQIALTIAIIAYGVRIGTDSFVTEYADE